MTATKFIGVAWSLPRALVIARWSLGIARWSLVIGHFVATERHKGHTSFASSHVAALCVLLALCGCAERGADNAAVTIMGLTMGTRYTVKLANLPPEADTDQLQAEIDGRLETINDQMSTYRPESELSRFNSYVGAEWFDVSPETALVVAEARRVSQLSGGAFDVTVGPLVNLWNFGPEPRDGRLPTDTEIAEAKDKVGYSRLDVRDSPPALRKSRSDMYVDLSAIAKGFAVDRIAELLDERALAGYMIEIGGEIRTKGAKPDGKMWTIGIETPTPNRRGIQKRIVLADGAMATSGDYRNFVEIGGKRYSHTIDPRTGRPIEHALASATVIADNCMRADAMATALMVLGPQKGYNLALKENLAALLIVRRDDGFVEQATPAFEKLSGREAENHMTLFLAAFAIFAVAVVAMALGVIFSHRCLRGTCGGLAGMRDEQGRPLCEACDARAAQRSGIDENHSDAEGNESRRLPTDAAIPE